MVSNEQKNSDDSNSDVDIPVNPIRKENPMTPEIQKTVDTLIEQIDGLDDLYES